MTQTQTTTTDSVRCRRIDAATGDQCTHRAPRMTADCGAHAPKRAKAARKTATARKATGRRETEAQFKARARRAGAEIRMNAKQERAAEAVADQMGVRN